MLVSRSVAYIYIYIPENGGTKASSRQTSVFFWRASRHKTWSAACESAVLRCRCGAYVVVMEGAEKQAGRLWDKFGMKEVVKEKCDTLYVGVGHQGNGMCLSRAGRYASYRSWKAKSALAKGRYHLSSSGGIPRARAGRPVCYRYVCAAPRQYGVGLKRSKYVFVTVGVFEVCNAYCLKFARRKKRHSLIWKSERARLSRDTDV